MSSSFKAIRFEQAGNENGVVFKFESKIDVPEQGSLIQHNGSVSRVKKRHWYNFPYVCLVLTNVTGEACKEGEEACSCDGKNPLKDKVEEAEPVKKAKPKKAAKKAAKKKSPSLPPPPPSSPPPHVPEEENVISESETDSENNGSEQE